MTRSIPVLRWVMRHDRPAALLNRALAPFNPLDPRRYSDPYPLYDELRSEAPIFHHSRLGLWLASGHAEIETVLRAPSSVDRSELVRHVSPYTRIDERVIELVSSMLLMTDPPDHTRLRKLVSRAFTPRAIAQLEPEIEKIASNLLDEITPGRTIDLMSTYASQLPIYIIGQMLGLPASTWPRLKQLSDVIARLVDPMVGFDPRVMERAIAEVTSLFRSEFAIRRAQPTDDLLSALVAAEEDGDRLSDDELVGMCVLLMVAGHETTTGLIGNAVVALERHPGERRKLIEDPSLDDNAIEELLRYDSPVQATDRILTEPLEVGGHLLPAGAAVGVFLGAGNHDPVRYDDPATLRLDRPDPRPLSFGHGIHHCVGAALARLEARVALRCLLDRFPDHSVDESQLEWKRSVTLRGPQVLPIRL